MKIRTATYLLLPILLLLSCKKTTTTDSPTIKIYSPASINNYRVYDTVRVSANVSDAVGLKTVSVYLMNSLNVQALPAYPVTVTSNDMTFNISYTLNDIHLASGSYFIVVNAYNGTNISYAYQQINITAVPQKRTAVYAITRSGAALQVYALDSVLHSTQACTFSGNFVASDVNSYYQQLFIAPLDTGNVSAFGIPPVSPVWSVPGMNSPTPFFTNVSSYGNAAWVSVYSGFVKYYDKSGALQMQIPIASGYYPEKTALYSGYLFVEERNVLPPNENLVLFNANTGAPYQQNALPPGELLAMFKQDNDDIFIAGNQSTGQPYLLQYKFSTNSFYSPVTLPSSKLLAATQVDANTYLLAIANQTIYQYTWNPNGIMPYLNGVTASHLRYDAVNNVLLAACGSSVNQYNYTNSMLMYSCPLPDSVLDIQILYNR